MLWLVLLFCGAVVAQDVTIETVLEICSPDMCNLLKEFGAMSEKLKALEMKLQESDARLNDTESRLQASEAKLSDTESRLQASEAKLSDTESRLQASEVKLSDTESRLLASEAQILELKNRENSRVMFSAAIGTPNAAVGPFDIATTLIYKNVITNIGSAYNSSTGIFTAPLAGLYYFTFFYHAREHHKVFLALYKNSEQIVLSEDYLSNWGTGDSGGNAVILQLQQGDEVFMRLEPYAHVWANNNVTTFSGYLITAM